MIDVIIPTYNRADSLKKVIDSYMAQPELGTCIIVDDCSTDDTEAWAAVLLQSHPGKVLYYRVPKKTTLPDLRNIGISLSDNEYIFMGEDDVIIPPDHFSILLKTMDEYHADIIAGRRIYLYEGESFDSAIARANTDTEPIFVRMPFEGYFERQVPHAEQVPFIHSNALMRRSIFSTVQYDAWYGGNAFREESDFYLRVTDAGFAIWLIPDTLSFHLKNASVNKGGGSRKKRLVYEYQVWKNTIHCYWKNRAIFRKVFGIRYILPFTFRSLFARYAYAAKRRIAWKRYEKA